MSIQDDDPRLVFAPEYLATTATDGAEVMLNRYWVHADGRGLLFFRTRGSSGLSPQCNPNEDIARVVRDKLYPWAAVKLVPVVYVRRDGQGRISVTGR